MKKTMVYLVLALSMVAGLMVPALTGYNPSRAQSVMVCGQAAPGYKYYLPIIKKEAGMMNEQVIETLEGLLEQPVPLELDAQITAVFEKTISARIVTSGKVRQNIPIPGYIDKDDLQVGQNVRLGLHNGVYILLAAFDEFADEVNYSGLGYPLPTPPAVSVFATRDGWRVQWNPVIVPGTRQRDVSYHVYINDVASSVSPTDVGITSQTSILIGYDGDPPTDKYVAVATIANGLESDVSAWVTDSTPPPVPDTFVPANYIDGHLLTISGDDASLNDVTFKCWEIQVADDAGGTGATSLGYFYPGDMPGLQAWGAGTTKYYRARSIDYAANVSDWTDWDDAWAMTGTIKDLFDGYGGDDFSSLESLYWLLGHNFDTLTNLETDYTTTMALDTTNQVEGSGNIEAYSQFDVPDLNISVHLNYDPGDIGATIDLTNEGRFTDDDYMVVRIYIPSAIPTNDAGTYPRCRIAVYSVGVTTGYGYQLLANNPGENFVAIKKSDFSAGINWSEVSEIRFEVQSYQPSAGSTNYYAYFDDFRFVKADPDDAYADNDTGNAWDRSAHTGTDFGQWHIYEGNRTGEPSKPYSYGQIKTAVSPSVWYLSHKPISTTDIITGTVQAGVYLKDSDGQAGLAFFVKDVTAGSWDMYVVEADSSANTITLAKYVAGTRTQIAQAGYTINTDQILK